MSDIVNKWGKLGFLDGIENDNHKEAMANAYEDAATYILGIKDESSIPYLNEASTLIFPIIRRSLCGLNYKTELDPEKLVKFVSSTIGENEEIKQTLIQDVISCWSHYDYEAEATEKIAELTIIELKNGNLLRDV